MPYFCCPHCSLTVHSVGGRFSLRTCPNCGAPLAEADRVYVEESRDAHVSREMAARTDAVAAGRRSLETLLWDLSNDEFQTLALVVSELISNGVKHTTPSEQARVYLELSLTPALTRGEIADEGPGFVPVPRGSGSPLDAQWGLYLVNALTDRWGVDTTARTTVWFEIDRLPTGRPAARGRPDAAAESLLSAQA